MSFLGQCIIGTFAAIGFICILKMGYDIIFNSMVCPKGKAVLYIYAPKEECADRTAASTGSVGT